MRNSDSAIVTALAAAPSKGLVPLRFLSVYPHDRTTRVPVEFCFWSEPVPASFQIADRDTGTLVTRNFKASAVNAWGTVRLQIGIQPRPWEVTLNARHDAVRDMLLNYDLRLAWVEYHRVPADPLSRQPVGTPHRRFLGRVSAGPETIPGINAESDIRLSAMSVAREMNHTNPMKRSDVAQQRRSSDRQMQYVDVAGSWDIAWGEASGGAS